MCCVRQEAGLVLPDKQPLLGLDGVLSAFITAHVGELVGETARRACPLCGLEFMEFRAKGRLGCPNDYQTFTSGLAGMFQELQGATRHVGKTPKRGLGQGQLRLRLRAQLRRAVERENYEEAARLRDQIRDSARRPADES